MAQHRPWYRYTGEKARDDAKAAGIELLVVKLPKAKKGFVLLPRHWVVERSFGRLARYRRFSLDFKRMPQVPPHQNSLSQRAVATCCEKLAVY